jgi:hypothetical protein
MLYICGFFAFVLAISAYRTEPGGVRKVLVGFCLLNLLAVGQAIYESDPYVFKLKPNNGEIEGNYRKP